MKKKEGEQPARAGIEKMNKEKRGKKRGRNNSC